MTDMNMPCSPSRESRCTVRPRQLVSFQPRVRVLTIEHYSDYSEDEARAQWWSREEFLTIKSECASTVKAMVTGKPLGSDFCSRGLEYRTPAGMKLRQQNKFVSICAVLDEQDRQWENHDQDLEALAAAYRPHSIKSQYAARQQGVRDEKAIEEQRPHRKQRDSQNRFRGTSRNVLLNDIKARVGLNRSCSRITVLNAAA